METEKGEEREMKRSEEGMKRRMKKEKRRRDEDGEESRLGQ